MKWTQHVQWAAQRPLALRLANRLDRSHGRLRLLDSLYDPPPPPCRPDLTDWRQAGLAAVWIGHATVLLRIAGRTVLTDPVFSNRVGLGLGLITGGPRRLVAPALTIGQLPPLDLIVISHAHFDHLDRPTLARLPKHVPVVAPRHTSDLIRDLGFRRTTELDWRESAKVAGLTVTARQVEHWGARTVMDQHRGFAAFLIEGSTGTGATHSESSSRACLRASEDTHDSARRLAPLCVAPVGGSHMVQRILFAGDTAYHEHFRDIGPVDLMVVGIGAYDPWIRSHANPEQAWAMARHVHARHVVPIHHSTFKLSHEPPHEPMKRLLAAAGEAESHRIVIRCIGGQWKGVGSREWGVSNQCCPFQPQ